MTTKISKKNGISKPKISINLTKVAISTLETLKAGNLRNVVVVGNFIENKASLLKELKNLSSPPNSSATKKKSPGLLKEKLEKALRMKSILEEAVQGDAEKAHNELAELCEERKKQVEFRHHNFISTTSPLAASTYNCPNRRRKGKKKHRKNSGKNLTDK
ncbi:uncharacterized protein LOC123310160 [Coccinella septempunctata]|uniref:uncharacterized protein LOC123310160 n=1 Tax=Coccinella septempunctata TaxID=41139 RepID=UPI001D099099|nr:uncharacterized protein LOC123310160 [Coccinella septempunctata]